MASKTLLANYKKLRTMLSQPHCDLKLLKFSLNTLKDMDLPKGLDHYSEICKLHYEIIATLEAA